MALAVKNLPVNEGDVRAAGLSPWVGKIPWRRAWQWDSCLENSVDRGPWQATVHWVTCRVKHDWSDLACTCMHPLGSWELDFSLQWHFLSPDYLIPGPPSLLRDLVLGEISPLRPQRFLSPQRFGSLLTLTLTHYSFLLKVESGYSEYHVLGCVCVSVCEWGKADNEQLSQVKGSPSPHAFLLPSSMLSV